LLIAFGWASPRPAASLSPPLILANSALGFLGVLEAGQRQFEPGRHVLRRGDACTPARPWAPPSACVG
jgi:hypothetical protein